MPEEILVLQQLYGLVHRPKGPETMEISLFIRDMVDFMIIRAFKNIFLYYKKSEDPFGVDTQTFYLKHFY